MIQERAVLKVTDDRGAKVVRCFRILGAKTRRRYAGVGDIIVASVQSAEPRKTVKKKDVVKVLVVRTKNALRRKDGSYVRFDENAVVLVDAKKDRLQRVFWAVAARTQGAGIRKIDDDGGRNRITP